MAAETYRCQGLPSHDPRQEQRPSRAFARWPGWRLVEAGPSPRCVRACALGDCSPLRLGFVHVFREGLSCTISACWDFPGGPVVENLPANAGDMGLIPGLGRFHVLQSHEARPCATTAEAHSPQSPCSATRESTAKRSPHATARETRKQQRRPDTAKNK